MDEELSRRMATIAARAGFDVSTNYCSRVEMVSGIRAIQQLPPGGPLPDSLGRALLENLRLVILKSAANERLAAALAQQASLARWTHLRPVSIEAADAYALVLRYHSVEVPQCLLEQQS